MFIKCDSMCEVECELVYLCVDGNMGWIYVWRIIPRTIIFNTIVWLPFHFIFYTVILKRICVLLLLPARSSTTCPHTPWRHSIGVGEANPLSDSIQPVMTSICSLHQKALWVVVCVWRLVEAASHGWVWMDSGAGWVQVKPAISTYTQGDLLLGSMEDYCHVHLLQLLQ